MTFETNAISTTSGIQALRRNIDVQDHNVTKLKTQFHLCIIVKKWSMLSLDSYTTFINSKHFDWKFMACTKPSRKSSFIFGFFSKLYT